MGPLILRRLGSSIAVLIGVTVLTFFFLRLIPGDPARALAGERATAEQIETTRKRLGLDQPLPVQYLRYMERLLHGDLGRSYSTRQEVLEEIRIYFPASAELMLAAMSLTVVVGIPLGIAAAVSPSRWVSSLLMFFSLLGIGIPVFWMALVFQLVFYSHLGFFPLSGRLTTGLAAPPSITNMYTVDALLAGQISTFLDAIRHLILPAVTLALSRVASVARITHASMVEVMRMDYIRTANAKGLRRNMVVGRHALKNALIPTVTTVGLQIGWLLGGTILIENTFAWGGIGFYAWVGIALLDVPVVMGITIVTTSVFVIVNLVTDLSYRFMDPRIRYE